jgi:AcrR family transcriptional regulator
VTTQDIADEAAVSTAALHYHYDGKRDLLVSFLDWLLDGFEERLDDAVADASDPAERLVALLDEVLASPDPERREFRTAMVEVRAQAPYRPAYRERLTAFDDLVRERVRDAVADGVDDGSFGDVDPDDVAAFLVTYASGAQGRDVAVGASLDEARRRLHDHVRERLLAPDYDPEGTPLARDAPGRGPESERGAGAADPADGVSVE